MAGKIVERTGHECGTTKGFNIYLNDDGSYSGFCFRCGHHDSSPYRDKPEGFVRPTTSITKSPEEVKAEIEAIQRSMPTRKLADRKLREDTLRHFEVKVSVSESDGESITAHYYPYTKHNELVAYKQRLVEGKKFWGIGSLKDVEPFGWKQALEAGNKRLYITEGEIDAMTVYQVLKDNQKEEYKDYDFSVISLAQGASGADKELAKLATQIQRTFKEIVLVFDNDKPGQEAVKKTLNVLPGAMSAELAPHKDPNEMHQKGHSKALFSALMWKSQAPKNTRLVRAEDLFEDAKKAPEMGYSWPWKGVTEKTRGIRTGETIYIGAAQKMGKSEVVNTLAAHCVTEHGWKVLLAKPEEANVKSVKLVAGKIAGKIFHDPNVPFDMKAYDEATEKMRGKVVLLNLYQHVGWETLKVDMRAAAADGCKAIFIDPITNLTNGVNAADANTKLQEIAQELSAMALDLDVVIFIFCHLRNPDSGLPHERGGEVLSSQFAGSRAMARSCNLMLGIEGNRDPSLSKEERNIRTLVLLEDREFGESGKFPMYWDDKTSLFNELPT